MGGRFTKPRASSRVASGRPAGTVVTVDPKYTMPCGLYVHKSIDMSRLRKLILAGRLAPCYTGLEECADGTMEECPICMLVRPRGGAWVRSHPGLRRGAPQGSRQPPPRGCHTRWRTLPTPLRAAWLTRVTPTCHPSSTPR